MEKMKAAMAKMMAAAKEMEMCLGGESMQSGPTEAEMEGDKPVPAEDDMPQAVNNPPEGSYAGKGMMADEGKTNLLMAAMKKKGY